MKKILLSCVTCLLALGLVTACEDEVEDATPEDPNAGVVEPGDNDGGSTEPGGSGDEEDFLPVLGTVTAGDYFLGIEVDSVPYYFDGTIYSDYYGNVTEHGYEAVTVTVTEVTGGYTLSFVDSDETTQYIAMSESGTHRNFVWSEETPYVWSYDTTFETFVALDSEGVYYYVGTYGTFKEMAMNEYSYLEESASSYAQYPAHLYEAITYVAPTAITVTAEGEASVEVGRRISLTAAATGEGNVDPRVTWTSSDESKATVSDSGTVLGVDTGEVTITATSVLKSEVKGELKITVTEAITPLVTYKLGVLDEGNYLYRWFDGTAGNNYINSTTSWDDAADVYIEAADTSVEGGTAVTISFYNGDSELKYIAMTSSTSSGSTSYYTKIVDEAYTWVWDATNSALHAESATGRFLGTNASYTDFRTYSNSNISSYFHVIPYSEKPTCPTPDEVSLTAITSISEGTYYLGACVDNTYYLANGNVSSYQLSTVLNPSYAAEVTVAGSENSWTLTIGSNYIYGYIYNNSAYDLGTSSNSTVPNSGSKTFAWDSTTGALTLDIKANSDTGSYLQFSDGKIALVGYTTDLSGITNAAQLYEIPQADV